MVRLRSFGQRGRQHIREYFPGDRLPAVRFLYGYSIPGDYERPMNEGKTNYET